MYFNTLYKNGMVKKMEISIVLLTYSGLDLVQQCLHHIYQNVELPYQLIVISNAAADDTADYLRSQQESIEIMWHQDDIGIAAGYNEGLGLATGDYVLFMNQYSLLTANCLSSMLRCLIEDDMAAMAGPRSNDVSGTQRVLANCQDMQEWLEYSQINYEQNQGSCQVVYRLLGHCLLVKKSVLNDIGYFDEAYGLGGYEDDDLCLRAINRGYNLYIADDAFVYYLDPLSLPSTDKEAYYLQLSQNCDKAIEKWGFDIAEYLLQLQPPITISLCMIVKNEEKVLARCLDGVKEVVDEIIIVDTGSTDQTKQIAYSYTDKVFDFPWIDDFAAARNFAFEQATKDYIMWLDADDIVSTENSIKIFMLKQVMDSGIDSVTMIYNLGFDEYGNVTATNRRNRLVKRSNNYRWVGAVHEYLAVWGQVVDSDIAITHDSEGHDSDRNIKIYKQRLKAGEVFTPRDQYYFANELMDHKQYKAAIKWYQKFLAGGQGWVEDKLGACRNLAQCCAQLGKNSEAMQYVLQSFLYDQPRAEFCCQIGMYFLNEGQINPAIFWFKLAIQLEPPGENRGFLSPSFWTWVPHLQLCVCYDRLGQYDLAEKHNEMAAEYVPHDPSVLHNREYLKSKLTEA